MSLTTAKSVVFLCSLLPSQSAFVLEGSRYSYAQFRNAGNLPSSLYNMSSVYSMFSTCIKYAKCEVYTIFSVCTMCTNNTVYCMRYVQYDIIFRLSTM
jgi:hypothetical protein